MKSKASIMEKRKVGRITKRAVVRFEADGFEESGIILNFSEVGLYLQSLKVFPPGSHIRIPIELSSKRTLDLQGVVVWSRLPSPTPGQSRPNPGGMGIELAAAPEEYLRFVAKIRSQAAAAPRGIEERFEVYHRVRFQSGQAFLAEYTENLSRGGMFLATDQPMAPGTVIKAQLDIAGVDRPIEVEGKVAYRLDPTQAEECGRVAGLGIQFVNLTPEARTRLNHYIKRLEIHRSNPDRRQIGDVPPTGSLNDFLVPELLLAHLAKGSTGTLLLQKHEVTKLVYLKNGHPVYIESSLRTETFGQFLVRQGKITPKDLEDSLEEMAENELHHAEIMMMGKLIDGATLANAFVAHQEEKLLNTFPWFEGTFEFTPGTDWPPNITILPLRTYQVVFAGIERWYDATLVNAWMGLDESSAIRRVKMPPSSAAVPPLVMRVLNRCQTPQTVRKLAEKFQVPVSRILPATFALVIAGWAVLDFSSTLDLSQPEFKLPTGKAVETPEAATLLRRWIDEDFQRLRNLNFYELFNVGADSTEADVTRAYLERLNRYTGYDMDRIQDEEVREKVAQMIAWIQLGFDTLRDPQLRQLYSRHGKPRVVDEEKSRVDAERLLLSGIRDIDQGNLTRAIANFQSGVEKFPEDPALPGYLGWALFQQNRMENRDRSAELIDRSLGRDPSDPQLHYYRGEIYAYLGQWSMAERHFAQAVRLQPNHVKASVARDLARDKQISFEKSRQRI